MIGDRVKLTAEALASAPHLEGEGVIAAEYHDALNVRFGNEDCWCRRDQVVLIATDFPAPAPSEPVAFTIDEES